MDGGFSYKILFSTNAHFSLGGYVNKQIYHNWSSGKFQIIEEGPLQPIELTVWSALSSLGVIGPYLFENYNGLQSLSIQSILLGTIFDFIVQFHTVGLVFCEAKRKVVFRQYVPYVPKGGQTKKFFLLF